MKKQFLNLGKALNKAEQKQISGGGEGDYCLTDEDCQDITNDMTDAEIICDFGRCIPFE